ncbi:MAG: hypothetical protein AB7U95_31635 [Reyranella sp.]
MALRDSLPVRLPGSTLGDIVRRIGRLPFAIGLAALWLVLMVVVALGADFLMPYSITAFDLKARLSPPPWARRSASSPPISAATSRR